MEDIRKKSKDAGQASPGGGRKVPAEEKAVNLQCRLWCVDRVLHRAMEYCGKQERCPRW